MNDALHCGLLERAGDVEAALLMGRRATEAAEQRGNQFSLVLGHLYYGMTFAQMAEWQDSRRSLELALRIARVNRAALFRESDILAALADVHLGLGDASHALSLAEEAIQVALRDAMPIAEVVGQLALARVLRAKENDDDEPAIEAALDRSLALVRSTGALSYEPQIYVERARLSALCGNAGSAEKNLREAHRLFTKMGASGRAMRLLPEFPSAIGRD
jgi:tetratricopeptide (TPR) repeat protein